MGKVKDFVGFTIKCDLTKMALNIYQPHLINNFNQGFNKYAISLMTLNNKSTPYKGVVRNQ